MELLPKRQSVCVSETALGRMNNVVLPLMHKIDIPSKLAGGKFFQDNKREIEIIWLV